MRNASLHKFMSCISSCHSTSQYHIHKRSSHAYIYIYIPILLSPPPTPNTTTECANGRLSPLIKREHMEWIECANLKGMKQEKGILQICPFLFWSSSLTLVITPPISIILHVFYILWELELRGGGSFTVVPLK